MNRVSIGNGLYASTKAKPKISLREWGRQLQASCSHEKRDPRGMCYHCGHLAKVEVA